MFATNRTGTLQKQHNYVTALWAQMRRDALGGGGLWACAYEEFWVEVAADAAEVDALFVNL